MTAAVALSTITLSSCAHLPTERLASCSQATAPGISVAADGRTATTTLDVLTYNVEGLPWPARTGRSKDLERIGEMLRELRAAGRAPDVVLVQEMFSGSAVRAIDRSGYPALVSGPGRTQRGPRGSNRLPGKAKPLKGELGLHLMTSGLAIASRYPIVTSHSEPYSRLSCAGFDCLANKGVLAARIVIPGVPSPIDLLNTHMNAQRASRVAPARHLASHNAQTRQLSDFLLKRWDRATPMIFGGDFNMRRAPRRFGLFSALQPFDLVHQVCSADTAACDVRMSWDGDAPWLDTQDLQLFTSGSQVRVRPIRVEAMFDGAPGSPKLSDHDGFRVTYELRWSLPASPAACESGR